MSFIWRDFRIEVMLWKLDFPLSNDNSPKFLGSTTFSGKFVRAMFRRHATSNKFSEINAYMYFTTLSVHPFNWRLYMHYAKIVFCRYILSICATTVWVIEISSMEWTAIRKVDLVFPIIPQLSFLSFWSKASTKICVEGCWRVALSICRKLF